MNFHQFLEMSEMDPYEAVSVLGLEDKAGQTITEPEVKAAWFRLAKQNHPDVQGEENTKEMQKINAAASSLLLFAKSNRPLPTNVDSSIGTRTQPATNVPTNDRPEDAQNHTDETIRRWAEEAINANFLQVDIYEKAKEIRVFGNLSHGTVGSKQQTFKLDRYYSNDADGVLRVIQDYMLKDNAPYPENIVWTQVARYGAWITYIWPLPQDDVDFNKRVAARMQGMRFNKKADTFGYRSIYFKSKPQKQPKGAGIKQQDVLSYLRNKGLVEIGGRTNDTYLGLPEHAGQRAAYGYLIKLQPRAFLLVHRYRYDLGYKKQAREIKLESVPYGKLRPSVLDVAADWVKKKFEQKGIADTYE